MVVIIYNIIGITLMAIYDEFSTFMRLTMSSFVIVPIIGITIVWWYTPHIYDIFWIRCYVYFI